MALPRAVAWWAARTTAKAAAAAGICIATGACSEAQKGDGADSNEGGQCDTNTNTDPFSGPVDIPVIVVDGNGNAIPVNPGESVGSSPDGTWQEVKDSNGNATGTRKDGGHPRTHDDPRAKNPHAHVPGVTNPDGTPWLPVN